MLFDGRIDLTRLDEADIADLGIGRKFQKPTVFESHTVCDNLVLALKAPRKWHLASLFGQPTEVEGDRHRRDARHHRPRASISTCSARALSHGQKQWLEIGMLLMQDPELLLVDEPVAGMTDAETETHGASCCARSPRRIRSWWSSTT